jgi:hypothetical protein
MLAVRWTCEIRVCIRVMRHGRMGSIDWADRLAIFTLDACHVQTAPPLAGRVGPDTAEAARGALCNGGGGGCEVAAAAAGSSGPRPDHGMVQRAGAAPLARGCAEALLRQLCLPLRGAWALTSPGLVPWAGPGDLTAHHATDCTSCLDSDPYATRAAVGHGTQPGSMGRQPAAGAMRH